MKSKITPNIITNIEQIIDVLEKSAEINLCDTCAISDHEHVYHHYGEVLVGQLLKPTLLLTEDVLEELKYETNERYQSYLSSFSHVLVVQTQQFYQLIEYFFQSNQAKARFQRISAYVFQTFVQRSKQIKGFPLEEVPSQIFLLYEEMFKTGKNKGEYSLLWLSAILREVFPNLEKIRFIGTDNDLYTLVDNLYFKGSDRIESSKQVAQIEIASTDTLLQALYRTGLPQSELMRLCELYRDPERKLYYQPIDLVLSRYVKYESLSNIEFINRLQRKSMQVIY